MSAIDELVNAKVNHLRKIAEKNGRELLSPIDTIDIRDILSYLRDVAAWEAILDSCEILGFINKQQGHRDIARELIEMGVDAAIKLNRSDMQGRLTHDLAEIHHQQGRHEEATYLFEESYQLLMLSGNKFGALRSKHMLVMVLRGLGKKNRSLAYQKAKEVLEEAREIAKEDHTISPWVAHPLEVMSIFARDVGNLRLEENLLSEALRIHLESNQNDQSIMLGQCYRRLGQLFVRKKDYEKAEYYYQESLKYSAKGQNLRVAATTMRYLGDLYAKRRAFDTALLNYSQAMNIAIDGNFTDEQIALSLSLAYLYFRMGQFYDALSEVQNFSFLRKTVR